jgi:acetate kinase
LEQVPWRGHVEAVKRFVFDLMHGEAAALPERTDLAAVGHRVVHGGPFTHSVLITPEIRARLAALADLAPLHNPPSLEMLAAAEAELPGRRTAARHGLPRHAVSRGPPILFSVIGREAFAASAHGLSHAYAGRAADILGRPVEELRLVICHLVMLLRLGSAGGRCVDTTMGFTPLEGLMMATRSGSIDPGIVLHLQRRHGLTADQVETALNYESGLLGVSTISADMREVLVAAREGHDQARLAVGIYTHRVRQAIGALAVTLGGVDALVFTAGVGEHSSQVREAICSGLECLGLELDCAANATCRPDGDVACHDSRSRILVIATREDVMMLREVLCVLGQQENRIGTKKVPGR